MNHDELIAHIVAYRRDSLGADDSSLAADWAEALDRYYGRPYGDEVDGRSKIVTKDLSSTVDWILPDIMKALVQGGDIAEFIPIGEDDEKQAKQESAYINHVIMNDNDGFMVLYDAIRDALVLKNGYWKHWWDETEKTIEREYAGLTQEQLVMLFTGLATEGAEVEVLGQEEKETEFGPEFEVKLRITKKTNRVKIIAVPPEEIRISRRATCIKDSPFTEHVTTVTRTDLIEMGMDKDFVYSLSSRNSDENDTTVQSRNSIADETDESIGSMSDTSMDEIEYTEAYIRIDYDDDGKAELRKVVTVSNKIPPGDEWNEVVDSVPITSVISKRVPHRHIGESLHDDLKDLTRIRVFMYRQIADNIYATNNNEWLINERVHVPDFLTSMPGGFKRVMDDDPVTGSAEPLLTPPIVDKILPFIKELDEMQANRVGVSKFNTVQDPNILRDSTKGAFEQGLEKSTQKSEMILRMVAHGVKDLVLSIHEILLKHQDISRKIKLNGDYVDVNPAQWRERTDLQVKVGLGTGSKDEHRQNLMMAAQLQQALEAKGLVNAENSWNLFSDLLNTLNLVNPSKYAVDPTPDENGQPKPEYAQVLQAMAQPQPNPLAEAEQMKGQMNAQIEQLKGQQKLQIESIQQQAKAEMELFKQQIQGQEQEKERQFQLLLEQIRNESKEAIEILKAEVISSKDIGKPGIGAELGQSTTQ